MGSARILLAQSQASVPVDKSDYPLPSRSILIGRLKSTLAMDVVVVCRRSGWLNHNRAILGRDYVVTYYLRVDRVGFLIFMLHCRGDFLSVSPAHVALPEKNGKPAGPLS